MFKLNINNRHCKHILLGCSHDNGYARLLEEFGHQQNRTQITLVEGVPFERELAGLTTQFAQTRFENVFRQSKIVNPHYMGYHPAVTNQGATAAVHSIAMQPTASHGPTMAQHQQSHMPPNAAGANGISNGTPNGVYPSPYQSPYQQNIMHRTSSSSGGTANSAANPTPGSWAAKAGSPAPPQATPPPQSKSPSPPAIARNKRGQRIDPLAYFNPEETRRVQKMKMCNVHFLRGDCQFAENCTHNHTYQPTRNELDLLRQVARHVGQQRLQVELLVDAQRHQQHRDR